MSAKKPGGHGSMHSVCPFLLPAPWLGCGLGVALVWPWGGFGVPMRCLSTGFGAALGWLCPAFQGSRFEVRGSKFSVFHIDVVPVAGERLGPVTAVHRAVQLLMRLE